jgi:nitric oxide synthase-interacting protein
MEYRESILEYLLNQTKELKRQRQLYEQQLARKAQEEQTKESNEKLRELDNFAAVQDVSGIVKRKASEIEVQSSYMESRKKKIDDTDSSVKKEELKRVSPWVVDFTPEAKEADIPEPPKCPPSPFSGRPLKAKDLVPVNLEKESSTAGAGTAGAVRFICPVSRF